MEEYHQKISAAHLEKEPQIYLAPTYSESKKVIEVAELKPEVESFVIHTYPSEHTVVLEGKNLWFCHEVHLGEDENNVIHTRNSADSETITGRSIQFNYNPTPKSDRIIGKEKVKVKLHSHFSQPIRKKLQVHQVCSAGVYF